MFTEDALKQKTSSAVIDRGRRVSYYGYIKKRTCSYHDNATILKAQVESSSYSYYSYRSSSSSGFYNTCLTIDEETNEVLDHSCTCPAATNYAGPCKHAVALGIEFIEDPESFRGYDARRHVATNRALYDLLGGSRTDDVAAQVASTEAPGTVTLEPTLVASEKSGDVFLRLRVVGAKGAYIVKSIQNFANDVIDGATVSYGKRLTLTHVESSFEPLSWQIAQWIVRGVRNRRAFSSERHYGYYYSSSTSGTGAIMGREMRLSSPELEELVGLLMGHTVHFNSSDDTSGRSPSVNKSNERTLTVCEGDPHLELTILAQDNGSFELRRSGTTPEMLASGQNLYAICDGKFMRTSKRFSAIADFLLDVYCSQASPILLAASDAPLFAANILPKLERAMEVKVPGELAILRPVPAQIAFYLDRDGSTVTAEAWASYGEERHALRPATITEDIDPRRDLRAESAARQLLAHYFAQVSGKKGQTATSWELPVRDSDSLARLLFAGIARMQEMGEVFTTPAFDRLSSNARPHVRVGVSVESNLLRLSVSADELSLDELHAVLSSYRRKKGYHRLRDGSLLNLEGLDLDEAAALADELGLTTKQLASGMVEIPAYKAFLLENMVSDEEKDESFDQYLEDFRAVDLTSFAAPDALRDVLRPYQLTGYQWLCALAEMGFGGILADEMGLGKTVQLIAFLLAHRGRGQSMVVCPASLVYNWQAEFERFAPTMDVAVVAGTAAQRRAVRADKSHEVLVTSYDLLRRDVAEYADHDFFCVTLDEAQFIKNHQTLAAQATKTLVAKHRFALTGTPVENRLSELWSIFDFLMPGLLGGYERFRERYEAPIVSGDEESAARLRAAVGPFILRRLKVDVLTDLPDKIETTIVARMEKEQLKLYQAHEQALRMSLAKQGDAELARGKLQILAELTKLRQLCCDPRLVFENYRSSSCKLDTIWELVSASCDAGAKVLIFSQFTSFLELIGKRLRKEHVGFYELTGSTLKKRRLELVNAFNNDDTPAFLISLKAGGTGLNLTGAQVVIHADPWWNVAAEDQATDRAHRIGQQSDVTVYKVICKNSIEERIVALQAAKADLAEAVVGEGSGQSLGSLSREDLLELLG